MPQPPDDRGRLARLLRRPTLQQRERAAIAAEIRAAPDAAAKVLVEEALAADEVSSAAAARSYVRFRLDRMDQALDGETRAIICTFADRRIEAQVPDTPAAAQAEEPSDD